MNLHRYLRPYIEPAYRNSDGTYSAPCPRCGRLSLLADAAANLLAQECYCILSHFASTSETVSPPEEVTPAPDAGEGVRLVQLGLFLQEVGDPPPMLVEDLIPDYSLIALTGKPKCAKSLCALDLLDAVCQGQPVFGTYPVNRPGPVVYLGMEDGNYEIANRLLQRGARQGDRRPFHLCTSRLTLGRPEAIEGLVRLVGSVQPVLIVVDTAREGLGINDWFNASEVTERVRPLRDFARKYCPVLLIAHNRKADGDGGDEISGSNAFTGSLDGWLSCFKKETLPNGNLRLFMRKEGRGGMRGEFALEMDTRTLRFTTLSAEQLAEAKSRSQSQEQLETQQALFTSVLRLMAYNGERATAAWIAEQMEMELRNAQRILKEIANLGWIADSGERAGEAKRAFVYALTEEGRRAARQRDKTIGVDARCRVARSFSEEDLEGE